MKQNQALVPTRALFREFLKRARLILGVQRTSEIYNEITKLNDVRESE